MDLELPHPRTLWVTAVVTDVLFAVFPDAVFEPSELAEEIGATTVITGGRVDNEDGAGNWYALIRYPGDRAVLFGWDRDNDLRDQAYDPRAAAPEWVRAVELKTYHPHVLTPDAISFVRWWEHGGWHRTPAEHEDGLYIRLREYAHEDSLREAAKSAYASAVRTSYDDDTGEVLDHASLDDLNRLADAARRHEVTEHHLEILGPEVAHAAYRYFWRAGIVSGAPFPVESLPATTQ
ncbi:hypothetical protein ACFVUS_26015 [Nocardia sp. NPDC058058]|uniref:hypothetical protein n=1 Tax=Nocardia sp. NPDC058058 TaxID=3346317 RepID=UPI0036D92875